MVKEKYGKLFEATHIGNMRLKNRVVMAPMHLAYVDGTAADATMTPRYIAYFKARARGGVGLIVTCHLKAQCSIDPYPINAMFPLIEREERIKEFAELAEAVHQFGAKIAGELNPGGGRLADNIQPGNDPVAPSEQPIFFNPAIQARALTKEEIAGLAEAFGQAALRLKRAGFDALYVHSSGYIIDQFLTPCWNSRTDEYGGSLENRMRFLKECIESAVKYVGEDYPMILGFNLDHKIENSMNIEDAIKIGQEIEKMAVIDAFYTRLGCYEKSEYLCPNAFTTNEETKRLVKEFKKHVNLPVIIDGKLGDPVEMKDLLEEGVADFVGMGRGFLADPEWVNKVQKGKLNEVRPCIRCMECFTRVMEGKYSKCSVNPYLGYEIDDPILKSPQPRKVLVIGGGPGGMQAALTAAERGHDVVLAEKSSELGGNLFEASFPDYKRELREYRKWIIRQIEKSDVKVELKTEVTEEYVAKMNPDAAILASGAVPIIPNVPGNEKAVTASDVLYGKVKVGDQVVVIGGGLVGCETAYVLAKQGKQIDIVEVLPEILMDVSILNRFSQMFAIDNVGIKTHCNMNLREISDTSVILQTEDSQEMVISCDTVIFAAGYRTDDSFLNKISDMVDEAYVIGDCKQARKIIDAVHEAHHIAKVL